MNWSRVFGLLLYGIGVQGYTRWHEPWGETQAAVAAMVLLVLGALILGRTEVK